MAIPLRNNIKPITRLNDDVLPSSELANPWRYPLAKVNVNAESMI